jgi:two-component system, NtrC family, response regulator HydG
VNERRPTLLAIDDEPGMLALVEQFANGLNFNVVCHTEGSKALAQVAELRPDAVLVDLKMPELDGLDVLRGIRAIDPACAVILMTGHATVDSAMEAVRLGALDYLTKPLDFDRLRTLLTTIDKGIERRETLLKIDAGVAQQFEFQGMIGRSAAMQDLFDTIRRLAPHVRTVLVTGETGTGKELIARALQKVGPRRDRSFVTVNCSAVVDTLFESELFGHQRGAFTGATETKIGVFEHADKGTLFLDEVGELPMNVQPKLLRAVEYGELQRVGSLESRHVDVNVIAATNRDLRAAAGAGQFRSDLFYRLGVMEIHVAPLRERRGDIPLLTAAFIRDCAQRLNRPLTGITTAAEHILEDSAWEGNVRELRSVVERACLLSESRMLGDRDILGAMKTFRRSDRQASVPAPRSGANAAGGDELLSTVQRAQIDRVLKRVGGNKTQAARLLGISRRSLYRWIDRLERNETPAGAPE